MNYARKNPGKLNCGSGGNGSAGHLAGESFKSQAQIFAGHIPYAGGPPAQFSAFVARELQKYKGVVAARGAKAD